ncbi:phage tail assembly protein [Brevibacterium album]|uniref:phage tail assembly protein n=1 Tax=Brevibacterium album TaxID=417948 RepID=UPI000403491C|nr:phage tail assembly protein [Brevibacterium album]
MKLADIKKSADKKYAPFAVELDDERTVLLRIPLRLAKEERQAITKAFEVTDEDSARDAMDVYEEVFRILIADEADADALIAALEGDLAYYQQLFNDFSESMQLGEAASSKN